MAPAERLDGKVVLVTGAANGVGAATARALVDAGASVALLDIDAGPLHEVAAALGNRATAEEVDITDAEAVAAAVSSTVERFGDMDAVIANAGIEILGWADEMPPEDFRRVVEVNLIGTWNTVHASVESVACRRGYILIVTSLSAVSNGPMNAAYNAAKAGVVAMARTMRLDLRHAGVDIGLSYLTYTDTPTARRAVEDPRMQSILQVFAERRFGRSPSRSSRGATSGRLRGGSDACCSIGPLRPGGCHAGTLYQAILERLMGKQVEEVRRSERDRRDS